MVSRRGSKSPSEAITKNAQPEYAAETLTSLGLDQTNTKLVRELILDTRHNGSPATLAGRFVVDIDLTILGRPKDEFDAYERAIRAEYAYVEETAFRQGQSLILQRCLARPAIYGTDVFRGRYETVARRNLQRSLQRLS